MLVLILTLIHVVPSISRIRHFHVINVVVDIVITLFIIMATLLILIVVRILGVQIFGGNENYHVWPVKGIVNE